MTETPPRIGHLSSSKLVSPGQGWSGHDIAVRQTQDPHNASGFTQVVRPVRVVRVFARQFLCYVKAM